MKRLRIIVMATSFLLLGCIAGAQVPQIINYQGRVAVNGTNFDGTGAFQFALVNEPPGTTTYWSNGVGAVSLPVSAGMYSVPLGDTGISNMTYSIPPTVFVNPDVRLRVWFNDGVHGSQQLTPDQRIASAGYALVADRVTGGSIPNMQVFNTNGTFAGPAGVTRIMVEVWGGGGAGGGTNQCCLYPAGGGGGGGYGRSILVVTPGTPYTVTIGAGGAGGAAGQDGGDSSFGNEIVATGGKCGGMGKPSWGEGGAGGTSTAQFSISGAPGGSGMGSPYADQGSREAFGGIGGSSGAGGAGGCGGYHSSYANRFAGAPGTSPGGGGGGGIIEPYAAGGSGGNGRVVVWW